MRQRDCAAATGTAWTREYASVRTAGKGRSAAIVRALTGAATTDIAMLTSIVCVTPAGEGKTAPSRHARRIAPATGGALQSLPRTSPSASVTPCTVALIAPSNCVLLTARGMGIASRASATAETILLALIVVRNRVDRVQAMGPAATTTTASVKTAGWARPVRPKHARATRSLSALVVGFALTARACAPPGSLAPTARAPVPRHLVQAVESYALVEAGAFKIGARVTQHGPAPTATKRRAPVSATGEDFATTARAFALCHTPEKSVKKSLGTVSRRATAR